MNFKPLGLEDEALLRPYFAKNLCRICDCTFGGTFMWRDLFQTGYAIEDGILYLKARYLTGDIAFAPPRGDTVTEQETFHKIIDESRALGIPPKLCAVSQHRLERIMELYPDARATTDPAWADYLYLSSDIVSLPGRKFSGQRNHINKFLREYADWSFEKMDDGNRAEIRAFFDEYSLDHRKDSATYDEGNTKTLEVLDHPDIYRPLAGALRVENKIVGASVGEIVGDTLFIHCEKSLIEYQGSYPMLVNQYAKTFASDGIQYINREEDDGVEGLRISKMSYHPVKLLEKFLVELPV